MSQQQRHTLRRSVEIVPFTGPDGAAIEELAGRSTGLESHSLASIVHPVGTQSRAHHHRVADEVYFIIAGSAHIQLGATTYTLGPGDVLQIRAGQSHKLWSAGPEDLKLIVSCAPAHSPEDVYWDEA